MYKKLLSTLLVIIISISLSACRKEQAVIVNKEPITLTYYKLYENEENISPIFEEFKKLNPHVTINYKKFTDSQEYLETIVSEIAEGQGPDIMSVPNTWIAQNYKKLSPAPENFATAEKYNDTFVDFTFKDNVLTDANGISTIYGIPLYVDTLGLFYNNSIFEANIPERGKPASTWEGLINDLASLTKLDENGNLQQSAIALGRGDNINRAVDIFYLIMAQQGVNFYNATFTEAKFGQEQKTSDIVKFINSFAEKNSGRYTWDSNLADSQSSEKELKAFAQGKTAMIFGYSYQYKEILEQIELERRNGNSTVEAKDLKIIAVPQFADSENPVAYASYMTEVVSRNSKNSQAAWDLLSFMVKTENLEKYYKNDFKPSSKRELIPSQETNPIFGPFVQQIAYAKPMPIADQNKYKEILSKMITDSVNQELVRNLLIQAQSEINQLIKPEGVYPFLY